MIQLQKTSNAHLTEAYNLMIATMQCSFEQAGSKDISLQTALNISQHKLVDSGMASAEEAHEIGEAIKQDINDAAEYMMETSEEFHDWLLLDIEIIERKIIKLFLCVAERTRLELEQIKRTNRR